MELSGNADEDEEEEESGLLVVVLNIVLSFCLTMSRSSWLLPLLLLTDDDGLINSEASACWHCALSSIGTDDSVWLKSRESTECSDDDAGDGQAPTIACCCNCS